VDSLKRYVDKVTSPIPVKLQLERKDDTCIVTFSDGNDDVLQDVELESVPDLISLLRWPMIHGGPMYTDAGQSVTWHVFEDIEYSDMDFLRPYIIYRDTRTAPEELPSRIYQFFGPSEDLTVEIEHVKSVCPLSLQKGNEHGECWQIILYESAPRSLKYQLENHMTGRKVHGLLASGRIWNEKLFELRISFDYRAGSAECLVFQEDDWIRRLLRGHGINLPSVPSGSYLKTKEEKWVVEIAINSEGVNWDAMSTLTGRRFNRFDIIFKLDFTNDFENELSRILEFITKSLEITTYEIKDFTNFEERLTYELEKWGYGESSPPCELFVELLDAGYSLILKLKSAEIDYEIANVIYQIVKNATWDEVSEGFYDAFNDGWISQLNITNPDEAKEQFNEIQNIFEFSESD